MREEALVDVDEAGALLGREASERQRLLALDELRQESLEQTKIVLGPGAVVLARTRPAEVVTEPAGERMGRILGFPGIEELAKACEGDRAFEDSFGTEEACVRWFRRTRWPHGHRCERCGTATRWSDSARVMRCPACRKQVSLTSGTLLEATKKPLRKWFEAAYLIVQRGVNAKTLQRLVGLTYKVAWMWCHKLRFALRPVVVPEGMALREERWRFDAARVKGGHVSEPRSDRHEPCGSMRLRSRDWGWPDEMRENESPDPDETAAPEAIPDDYPATSEADAHWDLMVTYSGSVSEKHLHGYLDETAFRRNRRLEPVGEAFRLVAYCLPVTPPRTYRRIIAEPALSGHPLSIFGVPAS